MTDDPGWSTGSTVRSSTLRERDEKQWLTTCETGSLGRSLRTTP